MRTKPKQFVWVIAYINYDLVKKLPSDLRKSNQYQEIEYNIPTVRVLKKTIKGKDLFKEIPLLFNYGFFKIPINWALNIDLLNKIKQDFSCISNWVKDRAKVPGDPDEEDDDYSYYHRPYEFSERDVPVATTSERIINDMCELADSMSIFSSEDINKLKPGDSITLMIYPFEGMRAKVIEINLKSKKIKVVLMNLMDETEELYEDKPFDVHFDNVFYTLYQGSHQESYNEENLLEDYHINRRKTKTREDEV